jgi:hypothetical protein
MPISHQRSIKVLCNVEGECKVFIDDDEICDEISDADLPQATAYAVFNFNFPDAVEPTVIETKAPPQGEVES